VTSTAIACTLRIIFAGLCALVPTAKGLTVVLMNPMDKSWNTPCVQMDHKAALSTRVAYFAKDLPNPTQLVTGQDGQQDAWFDLGRKTITLNQLNPGQPFSTKACWFRHTEVPHWFVPSHSQDARWAVDGSLAMTGGAQIKPELLKAPYPGLWAVATITQGQLKTASVLRGLVGLQTEYLKFKFKTGLIQALSDQVVVEIPFDYDPNKGKAPVIFTITDMGTDATQELKLFPTPGGKTIEVSITNLPTVIPPINEQSHFHCYCDLVQVRGNCANPDLVYTGFTAATGITCPLGTLKP
jgi:hypothetical protein